MKKIEDTLYEAMEARAMIMCKKYCKYTEEMEKAEEDPKKQEKLFNKYCGKCPMLEFYR